MYENNILFDRRIIRLVESAYTNMSAGSTYVCSLRKHNRTMPSATEFLRLYFYVPRKHRRKIFPSNPVVAIWLEPLSWKG